MADWMIYGYGYTGSLVAEQAVSRGHRPLLAGHAPAKVRALAERLNLEWVAVDLENSAELRKAVGKVRAVYHAAGPFVHTAAPMRDACLAAGAAYMDITGEIPVFQATFALDGAARSAGVSLISGCGFDVVPSDCLAAYVASQVPEAQVLDIAMAYLTTPSAGTALSVLDMLPAGGFVRRGGRLVPWAWGSGERKVKFPVGERRVMPIPLADLETAFRSTGIPNITTYLAFSGLAPVMKFGAPLASTLLSFATLRRAAGWVAKRTSHGPDAATRRDARCYLWASAREPVSGHAAEAWLETPEPYALTADVAVRCVERVLAGCPPGALTPAQAFGADFVLEVPGVTRLA